MSPVTVVIAYMAQPGKEAAAREALHDRSEVDVVVGDLTVVERLETRLVARVQRDAAQLHHGGSARRG